MRIVTALVLLVVAVPTGVFAAGRGKPSKPPNEQPPAACDIVAAIENPDLLASPDCAARVEAAAYGGDPNGPTALATLSLLATNNGSCHRGAQLGDAAVSQAPLNSLARAARGAARTCSAQRSVIERSPSTPANCSELPAIAEDFLKAAIGAPQGLKSVVIPSLGSLALRCEDSKGIIASTIEVIERSGGAIDVHSTALAAYSAFMAEDRSEVLAGYTTSGALLVKFNSFAGSPDVTNAPAVRDQARYFLEAQRKAAKGTSATDSYQRKSSALAAGALLVADRMLMGNSVASGAFYDDLLLLGPALWAHPQLAGLAAAMPMWAAGTNLDARTRTALETIARHLDAAPPSSARALARLKTDVMLLTAERKTAPVSGAARDDCRAARGFLATFMRFAPHAKSIPQQEWLPIIKDAGGIAAEAAGHCSDGYAAQEKLLAILEYASAGQNPFREFYDAQTPEEVLGSGGR